MSETGGLRLNVSDRIGEGDFADIFAPGGGNVAYKLFRVQEDIALLDVPPHKFRAEVAAYEKAQLNPRVARHTPRFFGPVPVAQVVAADGSDVSGAYHLDLCYSMERLAADPDERKFGSFFDIDARSLIEPAKSLELLFEDAGITHLYDCSILHWRTDRPVLIDFAVSDAAGDYLRVILPSEE